MWELSFEGHVAVRQIALSETITATAAWNIWLSASAICLSKELKARQTKTALNGDLELQGVIPLTLHINSTER